VSVGLRKNTQLPDPAIVYFPKKIISKSHNIDGKNTHWPDPAKPQYTNSMGPKKCKNFGRTKNNNEICSEIIHPHS
jgi:hypothetical protein